MTLALVPIWMFSRQIEQTTSSLTVSMVILSIIDRLSPFSMKSGISRLFGFMAGMIMSLVNYIKGT